MTEINGKEDDAFRVRVCEAIEQLGPHEALKALRVVTFPLEAMPEAERPTVVHRLIAHNLTRGVGFIHWSVLADELERRVAKQAANVEEG